jgi:hypothetical protein
MAARAAMIRFPLEVPACAASGRERARVGTECRGRPPRPTASVVEPPPVPGQLAGKSLRNAHTLLRVRGCEGPPFSAWCRGRDRSIGAPPESRCRQVLGIDGLRSAEIRRLVRSDQVLVDSDQRDPRLVRSDQDLGNPFILRGCLLRNLCDPSRSDSSGLECRGLRQPALPSAKARLRSTSWLCSRRARDNRNDSLRACSLRKLRRERKREIEQKGIGA